jgi:hypothetical protein
MKLESNYIMTEALGASGICDQVKASGRHRWTPEGKCLNTVTGAVFQGDQRNSNCMCLGPPPAQSGGAAVFDFFKTTFLPGGGAVGPAVGPAGRPSSAFTAQGLLLPAALVVGGVGLLLILKKKKKG